MCDWTFLSNLFSVKSDCPHRERFAYGGDVAATSEALMMNYDRAVRDWRGSGRPAAQSSGVEFVRVEGGAAVYRVGAGRYRFTVRVRSAR